MGGAVACLAHKGQPGCHQLGTGADQIIARPSDLPIDQSPRFQSQDGGIARCGFKMKLPRCRFLHLAAGAAALPAVTRTAWAQSYPTRPLPIIIGFPGGSAAMSPFSQQLMYRAGSTNRSPFFCHSATGTAR